MRTAMRHGAAAFLAITMCTSLFFIYSVNKNNKNSNTDGSRAGSSTAVSTKSPEKVPPPPPLKGYISIIDHSPLKMHCRSCSLVISSGHLTGGGRGKEIDSADCAIRMNDAPSGRSFGPDVGRRTTLRVIAHSSMQRVLRSSHELLNSSHDTFFIFWGPNNYMLRYVKGLVHHNQRRMNQVLPKVKVYIVSLQKMQQLDELFKKETGKDRRISNSWLSTGWFTMTIAIELCDRINVYGMVPPDFCKESQRPSVPYHYYEPLGPDECAMYISHERGRRGSHHRFITEKRVFANWARTFNIHFYQPEWSPAPLAKNSTGTPALLQSKRT